MLDLEPIRARFAKVEAIAKEESPSEYRLVAVHAHSAMDVPKLIAEVERLRHEVFTLTNSEDARVFIVEQERDQERRAVAMGEFLAAIGTGLLCLLIIWVVRNGWRSLFDLFRLRGEAVLTPDPVDAQLESNPIQCTHEAIDEEPDSDAADFFLWLESEIAGDAQIRECERRMRGSQ